MVIGSSNITRDNVSLNMTTSQLLPNPTWNHKKSVHVKVLCWPKSKCPKLNGCKYLDNMPTVFRSHLFRRKSYLGSSPSCWLIHTIDSLVTWQTQELWRRQIFWQRLLLLHPHWNGSENVGGNLFHTLAFFRVQFLLPDDRILRQ